MPVRTRQLLLEREAELERIAAAVEAAAGGEGIGLAVEAPAGTGKTSLLRAARELACDRGVSVLTARGGEFEFDLAFGVARQLLEGPVAQLAARERARALRGAAAGARAVLDQREWASAPGEGAVVGGGSATLHALYRLCANLAERGPMLVCVDDVHWSDPGSLRFLLYLLRRLDPLPVSMLVAARTGEPQASEALLSQLLCDHSMASLRPRALSEAAVGELVAGAFEGSAVDSAFSTACLAASGGNPFLLHELLLELVAAGVAPDAAAARRIEQLGPRSVARSILLRLSRMPDGAAALARAVAVLGDGVALRIACELANLEEARARAAIDALVAGELLREEPELSFVHPLVRASVYADLSASARRRAHRRAAALVQRAGGPLQRVAGHLLAVPPAGDGEVVATLRGAAREALSRGAPEAAASYLRRALAEPPPAAQRLALVHALGQAELTGGMPAQAVEHLHDALAEARDSAERLQRGFELLMATLWADRLAGDLAALDRTIAELRGADSAAALLLEVGLVGSLGLDLEQARVLAGRIERIRARTRDGAPHEPFVAAVSAEARLFANEPVAEVLPVAENALPRWDEVPAPAGHLLFHLLSALVFGGRFDPAERVLRELHRESRRHGNVLWLATATAFRATAAYRRGAIGEAENHARAAVETARLHGVELVLPLAASSLIEPLIARGRLDEAEEVLAVCPDPLVSALLPFALLLHSRGRLRYAQQRHADALADVQACGARLGDTIPTPAVCSWRSDAALALVALGDDEQARRLAEQEVQLARALGAPRALGVALRAAGLAQRSERERIALLQEAIVALERGGAALERAKAQCDLGAALRRSRRPGDARMPLRQALEAAVHCGATAVAEQAWHELVATGARSPRPGLSGPAALTASERRVAELAAGGLSNREIALSLFITVRTVENHLARVFKKLGVDSRRKLPQKL